MAHKAGIEAIKILREKTSASVNDVKRALETSAHACPASAYGQPSCHCDAKALDQLRARGAQIAEKRQGHATGQGRIESYVHHDGRLGALVEVNCETDFVARTPDFIRFCREVAMHVAATSPRYLGKDDVPQNAARDAEVLKAHCLLEQPFVKDPGTTVGGLLEGLIAKTGERVVIRRFTRFALGEAISSVVRPQ